MLADRSLQYSQPCTCSPASQHVKSPESNNLLVCSCRPASQHVAEEAATDRSGRGEPKRPVYVLKERPTAGRDEAAPGGTEAPAAERVTYPLPAAPFEGLVAVIWGRFGAAVQGSKIWRFRGDLEALFDLARKEAI
jgi:hypothetical protein